MTDPVKITIRGVTYPSIHAAAKALRVTRQAIYQGLETGRLQTVGLRRAMADGYADGVRAGYDAGFNAGMERAAALCDAIGMQGNLQILLSAEIRKRIKPLVEVVKPPRLPPTAG